MTQAQSSVAEINKVLPASAERLENEKAGNPDSPYILTPSCGLGSRNIEDAEKVFKVLADMKEKPLL